ERSFFRVRNEMARVMTYNPISQPISGSIGRWLGEGRKLSVKAWLADMLFRSDPFGNRKNGREPPVGSLKLSSTGCWLCLFGSRPHVPALAPANTSQFSHHVSFV